MLQIELFLSRLFLKSAIRKRHIYCKQFSNILKGKKKLTLCSQTENFTRHVSTSGHSGSKGLKQIIVVDFLILF